MIIFDMSGKPLGMPGGFVFLGCNRSGAGGVMIVMRVIRFFCAGLIAALLAAEVSAQGRELLPFQRPGAICLKMDLPLFADAKARELSALTALPHYVGSDKSIAVEPRSVRTAAHLGYIGLAAVGAFVNPAFLIIAAYHVAGLVEDGKTKNKLERPAEFTYIWSRK